METPDILKYLKAERTIRVEPGSNIGEFVEEHDLLAVLKSGEAELTSSSGQTRIAITPGTPLGILRKDSVRAKGTITAISQCELIPIDEGSLATLVEFNPRFTRDLIGVLVGTVRDLVTHLP